MADRVVCANSHMLVLDELRRRLDEAYRQLKGARHRLGGAGRPGEWDPKVRLADMDLAGIAEVIDTHPTGCRADEVHKIMCDSASRLYGL